METELPTLSKIMERIGRRTRLSQRVASRLDMPHTEFAGKIYADLKEMAEYIGGFEVLYLIVDNDLSVKSVVEHDEIIIETMHPFSLAFEDEAYLNMIAQCEEYSAREHNKAFDNAMKGI